MDYTNCMNKFFRKHIPFFIMISIHSIQIIFLIVFLCLEKNVAFAEFWTRTFGRYYTWGFSEFNSLFKFSITEVSFYIVVISCIFYLGWGFSLLRTRRPWDFIHRVLMITLIVTGSIVMYNYSVGAAYYREKLPLELYEGEVNKDKIKDICTYFVNDYNECAQALGINEEGEIKMPYTKEHMIEKLRLEFDKLDDPYYNPYVASPKPIQSSGIYTSASIVGMYFGVLGEVNYNTFPTNAELPYYIAHELCHAKGVMREGDANLLAQYVLTTSDDPYFRYSAYWCSLDYLIKLMPAAQLNEEYKDVLSLICDEIWQNNRYVAKHWEGATYFYDLGNRINDWYLKMQGEKSGTSSYDGTPGEVDPSGNVIRLSSFQSLYFKLYYDKNP